MYHHGFFWGMGGGWFVGAFLLIIIVVLILAGINRRTGPENYKKDKAMEILRERYAKGEISKEEFDERKRNLTS